MTSTSAATGPSTHAADAAGSVRVGARGLTEFASAVFAAHGVPEARAHAAAEALCYGDLTGMRSHGLANLTRLYLPLFQNGGVDPRAEPRIEADRGACVLLDSRRALGLWAAGEAMELAVRRAAEYGIGVVSVHGATHFGCAGQHALRAVRSGMVGLLASNCGRQRIARPPGGRVAMLGTNPLSVAAPAGDRPPFVLDMSTTAAPTGRVREAARAGDPAPAGWLADDDGTSVTDPAAFDDGSAHLLWLGGESGQYKGFGLGLMVEILAAVVSGAGLGPAPAALGGDGGPHGRDDDIGFFAAAVAPSVMRPAEDVRRDADSLFASLLACPPCDPSAPPRYPGWQEEMRAREQRRDGVLLSEALYRELCDVAARSRVAAPGPLGALGGDR